MEYSANEHSRNHRTMRAVRKRNPSEHTQSTNNIARYHCWCAFGTECIVWLVCWFWLCIDFFSKFALYGFSLWHFYPSFSFFHQMFRLEISCVMIIGLAFRLFEVIYCFELIFFLKARLDNTTWNNGISLSGDTPSLQLLFEHDDVG